MKNLLACDAFLTFGRRLSGKTLSARLTLCCNIRKNRDTPVFDNVPRLRCLAKQIPCAEISQAEVCTHNYCKASILRCINRQVCNNTTPKAVQKAVFYMRKGGWSVPFWRLKRLQKVTFGNTKGHLLQHERPWTTLQKVVSWGENGGERPAHLLFHAKWRAFFRWHIDMPSLYSPCFMIFR